MNKDSLGDRMKRYEGANRYSLTPRTPVIIRVDGRAFHTFMRNGKKPFDKVFIDAMVKSASSLAEGMQGFKLAYIQSDEASFLITDYDSLGTQGWFDYDISKIVSISASTFTAYFNEYYKSESLASFDSRAFNLPETDVPNYFIWRYKDWIRNSISMFARSVFSNKELFKKSTQDILAMLSSEGYKWEELEPILKYGTIISKHANMGKCHVELNYPLVDSMIKNETYKMEC